MGFEVDPMPCRQLTMTRFRLSPFCAEVGAIHCVAVLAPSRYKFWMPHPDSGPLMEIMGEAPPTHVSFGPVTVVNGNTAEPVPGLAIPWRMTPDRVETAEVVPFPIVRVDEILQFATGKSTIPPLAGSELMVA